MSDGLLWDPFDDLVKGLIPAKLDNASSRGVHHDDRALFVSVFKVVHRQHTLAFLNCDRQDCGLELTHFAVSNLPVCCQSAVSGGLLSLVSQI